MRALVALRSLVVAALAGTTVAACSGSETPPSPAPGELVVAFATDMDIPKDFNQIRVEILSGGATVLSRDYDDVGTGVKLPATLGLLVGKDPASPVTVRVTARRRGELRVFREAVTTVPKDRVALLRMPIQFACLGLVRADGDRVVSSCPQGETCIAGACASSAVDGATLPTFDARDVFGGGETSGAGTCFDTAGCFRDATPAAVDRATCSVPAPAGADPREINVALVPPSGEGVCGIGSEARCVVPLDGDAPGAWAAPGAAPITTRVALPRGACDALERAPATSVVVSGGCVTKAAVDPICGEGSSVAKPRPPHQAPETPLPDAGPPVPLTGGEVRCDATTSCDARRGLVCCWESSSGAKHVSTCRVPAQCSGMASTCDGREDCSGGTPACCLSLKSGAMCKATCDAPGEGERCSPTPPTGCPATKTCKLCASSVTVNGGNLGIYVCVTGDACPSFR